MYLWVCLTKCAYFFYIFFSLFGSSPCQTVLPRWRCQFFNCYTILLPISLIPTDPTYKQQLFHSFFSSYVLSTRFSVTVCSAIAWCVSFLVWLMSYFFSIWVIHLFGCFHLYFIFSSLLSLFVFPPLVFTLAIMFPFCFVVFLISMFCKIFNLSWYDSSVLGTRYRHACIFLPEWQTLNMEQPTLLLFSHCF